MKSQVNKVLNSLAGLALLAGFLAAGSISVAAAPQLQLTPAVDPMSTPTVAAPTLDPQNGLAVSSTTAVMGSGQMPCPMMNGSMSTTSGMAGTTNGMTGMTGMAGMADVSDMPMAQMGGMTMAGASSINDVVSSSQSGLLAINPWWVLGWILSILVVVALLVFFGLGIARLIKQKGKEKPSASE